MEYSEYCIPHIVKIKVVFGKNVLCKKINDVYGRNVLCKKSRLCAERMSCVKGDPNLFPCTLLVTFPLKLHLIRAKLNPPGVLDICSSIENKKTTNLYKSKRVYSFTSAD